MAKRHKIKVISAGAPGQQTWGVTFAGKHYTEEEFAVFEKLARERNISTYEAIKETENVAAEVSGAPVPELKPDRRQRKRKLAPRSSVTPLRWR